MSDSPEERETKATEALITAALHAWDHEITPDDVKEFLGAELSLSAEDEAALVRLGANPLSKKEEFKTPVEEKSSKTEQLLALHRKKPRQGFSETTEKEIARRREELRERIIRKRNESHD
jgi:hypothetical protein